MKKLKEFLKEQSFLIAGFTSVIISFFFTYNIPFFGDAVPKLIRADWFYQNNFSQWVVPTQINSGHPPLWILMLAVSWKLFGNTLLVSRLLLLALNLAVVVQLQKFIKNYGSNNISKSWYLLLLLEPTYLAQTTMLSNNVLLLLLCLIAANNIFKNRIFYSLALIGILLCNTRGILFFAGFALWDLTVRWMDFYYKQKRQFLIYSYIAPVLFYLLFLGYQYYRLGWVLKSPIKNLVVNVEFVNTRLILKNFISIVLAFLDSGRGVFWVLSALFLTLFFQKRKKFNAKAKKMLSLWFCIMMANLFLVFTTTPMAHRYFMFLYIVGLFVCINLTHLVCKRKKARWVSVIVGVFLVSGHFWVSPSTLSQGWDSSLAYLNYFEIKDKMEDYVKQNKIPLNKVGTKTKCQNQKNKSYTVCNNINDVSYFVYSNIECMVKKEEIDALNLHWKLVKEFKKGAVFVRLYHKPLEK